ncbi:LysR family transcriptional regulator [Tardiphaga sp. P9-11]|uniref:LysR family transcriptional regulator n=1 Tax=Tardiphaga sp. P9-11 TaxID=2024614 RepID=UPI0011F2AC88|nr:LysR family transcriptional regulator [Tardiphaga sp. P9-11]KAA0075910.1 LysR family transcriptional regulator [Tardiphaga sp. P9-11]
MDSISALTVFVRAAELRNFTDVARQLNLSSSAIGKAISRLEERHGVRLFHRSTRTVTLTQEGRFFLDSCRRILAEFKRVEAEFKQTKCVPRGPLRVSLPAVSNLLVSSISDFMTKYPDIGLNIEFTDEHVDVIEGGYDLVVRAGAANDSRLMTRQMGRYHWAMVGSPGYFERNGTPSIPHELLQHACLRRKCARLGRINPWPVCCDDDLELPETITTTSFEALIALAVGGHGLACVPEFAVREQIAAGTLVSVMANHLPIDQAFCAVWPTSQYLSPRLRVFLDFLAKKHFPILPPTVGAHEQASVEKDAESYIENSSHPRMLTPLFSVSH